MKWPDDFPDEAQRGQTETVRVTLNDVKRKAVPPMDDAFAREVGDFESLDALKTAVRTDLERHAEHEIEADVRQQLIDQIISANAFDVPKSWVQQFVRELRRSLPGSRGSAGAVRGESSARWRSARSGAIS